MYATSRIGSGERIAAVPRSAVFSAEAILDRRSSHWISLVSQRFDDNFITQQLLAVQAKGNSKYELMRLALLLTLEQACMVRGEGSPWAEYITHLPAHTPNALRLSEADVDEHLQRCGAIASPEFHTTIAKDQRFFSLYTQALYEELRTMPVLPSASEEAALPHPNVQTDILTTA